MYEITLTLKHTITLHPDDEKYICVTVAQFGSFLLEQCRNKYAAEAQAKEPNKLLNPIDPKLQPN